MVPYAEAVLLLTSPSSTISFQRGREKDYIWITVGSYNDSAMVFVLLCSAFLITPKRKHCFSFQEQKPWHSTLPDLLYALWEIAISVLQHRPVICNYLLNLHHSYTLTSETCKNPLFFSLSALLNNLVEVFINSCTSYFNPTFLV